MITEDVLDLMLYGPDPDRTKPITKPRRIFADLLKFFRGEYRTVYHLDGPLHDPLAVAAILEDEMVESIGYDYNGGETFEIDLVVEGEQRGRTVAKKLPAGTPGLRIPRNLDVDKFWRVMEKALSVSDALK